ncbi:MAG: sulfatase-like hydrolase/transferase [Myxococcales bacterium]|nr:sulfatase-like hydrolase/transferase [Myxococcales bacterium]
MSAAPPAGVATLAPRMLARAGRVLLAWALLIALENVVVGVGYRHLFVGYWEMAAARVHLSPLLLVALVPAALALACAAEVSQRAPAVTLRRASSAAAALFGAVAALSVSTGRHTESWAVRAPFMLATGLALGAIAWAALPRLHAASPGQRAALGVGLTGALWSADSFVLPRLYPGFHWACFFLLLPASSLLAGAWGGARSEAQGGAPRRWPDRVAYGALALALAFAPLVPRAARAVSRQDNLRLVLLERAPLLGRAVRLAARVAPPEDTNEAPAVPGLATESARALDWTGGDVVLLTVDALRADHVTSYGYGRATTPHLDALAARGTRFDRAYCATPHTSYSVTSMLTGKYMKPLLALGVGDDSETWAALLRRYGFRTAGFYPPAVFFIDEARFATFRDSGFGFEYRKVEFADRATRVAQVKSYLSRAPHDKPLFLWVHLFEPHEPYEAHAGHIFGEAGRDVDRYDSEIAEADATVGDISAEVERRRPGATLLVTADHGEEFGEHGGRYHGTTVYEEQVRVPLVIVGRGVRAQVASAPVQTIDLLPTVLSALGIPRPARVRGRDLGAILRDGEVTEAAKRGFAFSETDDYALVAEGSERLVCARKVGACTLFDVATDPGQRRDRGGETPARLRALRARLAQTERDHGRYEGGAQRPEALRRGRQGDVDAAEDVAALFDDASVAVRREAAEVAFLLHQPSTTNGARRALAREDDPAAKSFLSLVLVRSGATDEAPRRAAVALLEGADAGWRRRAALALADGGDPRGLNVLAAWLAEELELEPVRELCALFARYKARVAVPNLIAKLTDLRVRPFAAQTLGAIGDPAAKPALLAAFAAERYHPTRERLAEALTLVGAKDEMYPSLARFSGVPEPLVNALSVADRAGLLVPRRGGLRAAGLAAGLAGPRAGAARLEGTVRVSPGRVRVLLGVPAAAAAVAPTATLAGQPVELTPRGIADGLALHVGERVVTTGEVALAADHPEGVRAAWVVPVAEELPPPPREAWDAGAQPLDDSWDSGLSGDAKGE